MIMTSTSGTPATKLNVFAPYSDTLNVKARQMGGRFLTFDSGRKGWQFDIILKADVLAMVETIFGVAPRYKADVLAMVETIFGVAPRYKADAKGVVRLRVTEELREYGEPVVICGCAVASARGRDGGATADSGVSIVKGSIGSGGSVKNWASIVDAETEIVIVEFPEKYLTALPDGVELISFTPAAAPTTPQHPVSAEIQAAIDLLRAAGYTVSL